MYSKYIVCQIFRLNNIVKVFVLLICLHLSLELSIKRGEDNILFVHIPKTAGMSFRYTINKEGDFDVQHTELCFKELFHDYRKSSRQLPFTLSFFRAPRPHVYSQFLECKYDSWGKRVTSRTRFPRHNSDKKDFETWVDHFFMVSDGANSYSLLQ